MSAQKVWECIKLYKTADARRILSAYSYRENLIVAALNDYGQKGAYHGHGSDPKGQIAQAADNNLKAAIAHIGNKPVPPVGIGLGGNKQKNAKQRAEEEIRERMFAVVDTYREEPGTMKMELDKIEANWANRKDIHNSYELAKKAKLEARKARK